MNAKVRKYGFALAPTRILFVLFLAAVLACGQFTSGVEGTVMDPTGAVVPGARVTLRNVNTGETRMAETTGAGYYRFPALPPADFDLTVAAPGFRTALQSGIRTQVADTRTINFNLEIGAAEASVEVSAQESLVEASEARVSGYVDQQRIQDLPLVGRNTFTLVILTPGVTGIPAGGGQSYAQAGGDIFGAEQSPGMNANGARGAGNYFAVDAASTNNAAHGGLTSLAPNAEAVQEIRISTNNFSAEYGRNSSIVVNIMTKQGSNTFHGSGSWFFTDQALQARTVFQSAVPDFTRNEYAGSFGGPIWKDHTFFFGSVDVLRSNISGARTSILPTQPFIDWLRQNKPDNASTAVLTRYKTSVMPDRNFQTVGALLGGGCNGSEPVSTSAGPMPCNLPVLGETNFAYSNPRNGKQYNFRVDHNMHNYKDRIYFNMFRTTLETLAEPFRPVSPYSDFNQPVPNHERYINVNYTHSFTPAILNEMGATYNRAGGAVRCDPCDIPGISVNAMESIGNGWAPGTFIQNIYEWRDVLSITRGSHSLKIGGQLQHNQDYADFGKIILRPSFYFSSVLDFAADAAFSESNIGIDPKTGQRPASAARYIAFKMTNVGLFIQDNWKVKPNLALNLGLRWENFGNPGQRHDKTTALFFQGGNDFRSRIANGRVDYTPNNGIFNEADKNNFAPRIGFAWDPTRSGKWSIRGGAGTFYERLADGPISNGLNNPPGVAVASVSALTPPTVPRFTLGASAEDPYGFPLPPGMGYGLDARNGLLAGKADLIVADRDMRTQYSFNWFLGVQRSFSRSWVVEADYIGSVGRKLYAMYDVNRFAGDLIVNNGVLRRLNTSFGAINYVQGRFNSEYHGGTALVRKRFDKGLSFDVAFTLGKTLDGVNVGGGGNEYDGIPVADADNLARERGLAVFDIPRKVSSTVLYELPAPSSRSGALKHILGGWQLSEITILQSGRPFSVVCSGPPFQPVRDASGVIVENSGCDYNADGNSWDYPMTPSWGNSKSGLSRSDYMLGIFKPADFAKPPLGKEGDLGRNTFRGPGFANVNFALAKRSRVPWFTGPEGAMAEFRTEFFNIFNRVNLTQVDGNLASSTFGRSTSAYGARNIQFALRFQF